MKCKECDGHGERRYLGGYVICMACAGEGEITLPGDTEYVPYERAVVVGIVIVLLLAHLPFIVAMVKFACR